jgi:hypothetical protein
MLYLGTDPHKRRLTVNSRCARIAGDKASRVAGGEGASLNLENSLATPGVRLRLCLTGGAGFASQRAAQKTGRSVLRWPSRQV